MTTLIQPASNVSGATTVTPLYVLRQVSQNGTVTSSAVVIPSSITTLGATGTSDSLTYDAISLLQSFSPTFSVSGLTAAQQKQLALALGLNANATSTDLTNAINALLTPANPADSLINVLVGGAATTETTNPIIPSFLDTNGEIAGVPATPASQVSDAVFAALLDLGTTVAATNTSSPVVNNTQSITENPSTVSVNLTASAAPAATEAATSLTNPVSINTQVTAANTAATSTGPVQGNSPAANLNEAMMEYLATAALNIPATAPADINASSVPVTLPTGNTAQTPPAATATSTTPAINATAISATAATVTPSITVTPVVTAATTVAIANVTDNFLAEITTQTVENLSPTGVTSTVSQATPIIAQVVTQAGNPLTVTATAATGGAVVSIFPPTATTPEVTVPVVNTTPITFDNADSVLQALLADAAAHALITANQAAATYSVPGAIYQLNSGVDHTRLADLKGKLPVIGYTLNPVAGVAAVRGTLERQT